MSFDFSPESDVRWQQAKTWLADVLSPSLQLLPLADDASFRRYFRVIDGEQSYVLMDAPPDKEDIQLFLQVRAWMHDAGVHTPALKAQSAQGFLLLEDFGDCTWAKFVKRSDAILQQADLLMPDAMQQLHVLRHATAVGLKPFDVQRMHRECDLFLQWYLPKVAGVALSASQATAFHDGMDVALQSLAALPTCPVHLDYHSRNLMVLGDSHALGVIDFQDAVHGPVTYDLASIVYDCYQDYPETARKSWSEQYFAALDADTRNFFADAKQWHLALRLTAFQRHIKAMGIFARLAYRDGKKHFLDEIPLTRKHLLQAMPLFDLPDAVCRLLEK